ncbi:hypothetical protein Vretimale_12503, partial [Volvox reticuliferus]
LNYTALSGLFEWSQSLPAHIKLSYHGSSCKVLGSYAASPAAIVVVCCCGACEKKPAVPFRSGGSICSLQDWSLHVTLEPLALQDLMVVQQATANTPVPFSLWLRAASLMMGGEKLKRKQLCVYWYDSVNQEGREPRLPSALISPGATAAVGVWRAATIIDFDACSSRYTVKYHTDHKKLQSYLYLPITMLHFARMPPAPGTAPRNVAEGFQPLPSAILQTPPTLPLAHLQLLRWPQQQQLQEQQQQEQQDQQRQQQLLLLSASNQPTLPTAAQPQSTLSKLVPLTTLPLAAGAPGWSVVPPVSAASMTRGTVAAATTAATTGWIQLGDIPSAATAAAPNAGSAQPQLPVPHFNSSSIAAITPQPQVPELLSCSLANTGGGAAESGCVTTMHDLFTAFHPLGPDQAPGLPGAMLAATVAAWQQQQQQQQQQLLQQQQHHHQQQLLRDQIVDTGRAEAADATVVGGFQIAHVAAPASMSTASETAVTASTSFVSAGMALPAAAAASLAAVASGSASTAINASACPTVLCAAAPIPVACIGALSPALASVPGLQHAGTVSSPLDALRQPPSQFTSAPQLDSARPVELGPLPPVVQPVRSVATADAATTAIISTRTTNASWASSFDNDSSIGGWQKQPSPAPAATAAATTAAVAPGPAARAHGASYPNQLLTTGCTSSSDPTASPEPALLGQLLGHLAADSTVTPGDSNMMDLYEKEAGWAKAVAVAGAAGNVGRANNYASERGTPRPSTAVLGSGLEDGAFLEEMMQFLTSECSTAPPTLFPGKHPCQSAPPTVTGFSNITAAPNVPTSTPEGSSASSAAEAAAAEMAAAAGASGSLHSSATGPRVNGAAPVGVAAASGAAAAAAATMVSREDDDDRDDEAWASVRREVRRLENLCSWAHHQQAHQEHVDKKGGPDSDPGIHQSKHLLRSQSS